MSARERLPNRRQCESFEFRHAALAFAAAGVAAHSGAAGGFASSNAAHG